MNRRRILSSVHRNIARQTSTAVAPVDHATVARLSIADLDRLGPRLVTCGECNGTGKLTRLGGDWGQTGDSEVPCWACAKVHA